jgi:hypothetical protein
LLNATRCGAGLPSSSLDNCFKTNLSALGSNIKRKHDRGDDVLLISTATHFEHAETPRQLASIHCGFSSVGDNHNDVIISVMKYIRAPRDTHAVPITK